MLRVTAISVLALLSLLVVEAFIVQPVFADTVEISKPEYEKKWKGWRTFFNVTNSGNKNRRVGVVCGIRSRLGSFGKPRISRYGMESGTLVST